MNDNIAKISKKLEKPLEVLGLALLLTAAQVALYHIIMSDRFVNYYISLYQNVLVKIDIVYRGYIKLLEVIFGPSYTTVLFNFYEKIFILIFRMMYFVD